MSRFLLATNHLLGWTGSEITVATLGAVLREAGHQVLVYAPFWGRADVEAALLDGLPATQRLADAVAFQPDAAYTQHHPVATAVRGALPACPMAHAVLGVLPYLEQPPRRDLGLARLLPISEEAQAALLASGHPQADMALLRNLVDDRLFSAADDAPPAPLQTITCYSYKLRPADLQALQAAAAARDLALRADTNTGAGSTPYADAPGRIGTGQLVVASGRGAIEAMLCGRSPLILADCGDDGLVTPENFTSLMRTNFSGRTHGRKFSADQLDQAIDAYRPEHGAELRRLALEHFGLRHRRAAVLDLFDWLRLSGPPALSDQALQSIRFESEGLELQRQFAVRAANMRQNMAAAQAGLSWRDHMRLGHAAWRVQDLGTAMDHYLAASRAADDPAAMRSVVSLALTQLAARERRAAAPAAQRAALEAFLRINPGHAWALDQLARLQPPA